MLQFGTKNSRRAWHVIPAQEVKTIIHIIAAIHITFLLNTCSQHICIHAFLNSFHSLFIYFFFVTQS